MPVAVAGHKPVDRADHPHGPAADIPADLTAVERELLADLFAIVSEHADEVAEAIDRPVAGHRDGVAVGRLRARAVLLWGQAACRIVSLVRYRCPSSSR